MCMLPRPENLSPAMPERRVDRAVACVFRNVLTNVVTDRMFVHGLPAEGGVYL